MRSASRRRSVQAVLSFALIAGVAGCGADATAPGLDARGPIAITPSESEAFVGDVFTVHAVVHDVSGQEIPNAPVTFESGDATVALVDADGQVVPVRAGTASIIARSGDLTGELRMPIRLPKVATVTILGLPDTLGAGDVALFGVRVQRANGRDVLGYEVQLASSNPSVALIDPSGRVRAVSAGRATITATVKGVVGSATVVVSAEPAELHLRRADGQWVPTLVESDSGLVDGVVQHREIYLEIGSLRLTGGATPGYETTLHYAWYEATVDAGGQKHLRFIAAVDIDDHGTVQYDARGDLIMSSQVMPVITHTAGAEHGGFAMRYRFIANHAVPPTTLFFRREPK
jgi:hypothetical protein